MGKSTRKRKSAKSIPEASQGNDGDELVGAKQSVEDQISNLQSEKDTSITTAEPVDSVDSGDPESVARTVCQALQAGQVSLVAKIVSTSSLSQDFIQKTVALLPAESVLPLLAVIQSKFEKGKITIIPLPLPLSPLSRSHCVQAVWES